MFQKIRLQFLNNEACPVSAGANMDIIQAGGTDIKINIIERSQPWHSQSVRIMNVWVLQAVMV